MNDGGAKGGSAKAGGYGPSIAVALGASIWGLYWLPLKAIEKEGVPEAWAVALFNAPAVAIAFVALFIFRPPQGADWRSAALAGCFAGAGLAFYATGLLTSTVVRVTLLFYLTPIWATLIGMAFLGERPGLRRWAALALAVIGLALTLKVGVGDFRSEFGVGEALGLASGLAWAIGAVLIRRRAAVGVDAPLTFVQFFAAFVMSCLVAIWLGAPTPSTEAMADAAGFFTVGMSIAILVSMYVIFRAMAQLSPGRSGLLMMTEVLVAVGSAAILLPEEALTGQEWLGAVLIVGAGVLEVGGEA